MTKEVAKLNACFPYQNLYVEVLISKMMVVGGGDFGRDLWGPHDCICALVSRDIRELASFVKLSSLN